MGYIGKKGTGMLLVPGMIFTIEPMVNMGKADIFQDEENGWTIYTEDGKALCPVGDYGTGDRGRP